MISSRKEGIAVFSLAYAPFVGGAEVAVREIARHVSKTEFIILTKKFDARWPDIENDANISVVRLGAGRKDGQYYGGFFSKLIYVFLAWRAAERIHKQKPFKAIWSIMAAYAGLSALLFKLRHPEVPFLLTLQEGDSEIYILKRVGIFYPFWRWIFRKADHIQAISNYLADFARRHGARCPIEVVPNGVALDKLKVKNDKSKIAGPVIITTSRLVHKNGVDILIRAAAQLPITNYQLLILGGGPEEEGLKKLAAELGVADRVKFFGHLDPEKVPEYLAKADFFVRASRSEGLGSSFLEAMAAGLPVIGTPVGGIPDFLKDRATGLFCAIDNPKDLSEKISLLFADQELAERIAQNGQRLVRENYSWDGIASKMNSLFERLTVHSLQPTNRILIATGIYPPDIGGPATYTKLLEEELPKRRFLVGHLAFTDFRKKPKIIRHLYYFWNCWKLIKGFDFVYAQDPASVGLPALIAARLRGKKFFIRVAGDYAWEQSAQRFGVKDTIDDFQKNKYGLKVEFLRKIQKFVVGQADLVITPSKYFQQLVGGWVKNPEKVQVIYNGINLLASSGQQVASKDKTILSAGRLVPWKGFDVLIEIMKELPDWRLVIVGDGPERANLQLLITNYQLQDQIQLAGAVSREELEKYLSKASVFVLNTSFESFSFQVVEAMNAGVPIVATKIGSIPELIEDGREGIIVQPNNKEQIIAAIKKIDSDPLFRESITENAKKKAGKFSIERTVNNLVELISHASGR